MIYAVLACGIYLAWMSLIMKTEGFMSFLLFKLLPFTLSTLTIFNTVRELGWL